jgi:glucan phosphorylase
MMNLMTKKSREHAEFSVLEVAMEMALTDELLERIAKEAGPQAARHAAMSTSVGGIGPLLRERIIAQAELGLNVVGVSLLYETVWCQGWQAWNHLLLERRPIGDAVRRVLEPTPLTLSITLFDGSTVSVKVWKSAFGAAPVYYLDCPQIADVVYPCQEDAPQGTPNPGEWEHLQRLRHSWLVGRGASS